MSQTGKPKRLFKVATEFNVATKSIVDSLAELGYNIDNKPNTRITPEMYQALEGVYKEDKVRSEEHIRAREEYAERRTSMRNQRNESVTLESYADSIEDLEPLDEKGKKDDDMPLEPLEQKAEEAGDSKESEKSSDTEQASTDEAVADSEETGPESKESAGAEAGASGGDEEIVTPEEEVEPEEEPEPAIRSGDKADRQKEDVPANQEEDERVDPVEPESEIAKPETGQPDAIDEEEPGEGEDESSVIRARREKLTGTRVLGKIRFPEKGKKETGKEEQDSSSKSAKKKEKAEQEKKEASAEEGEGAGARKKARKRVKGEAEETATSEEGAKKKKKKRIRSKKSQKKVDEEHVETKMKETLQQMQSGAGKKRQKLRRQKREEIAAEREKQEELEQQESDVLEVSEFITVSDLAEMLDVNPTEIITHCMNMGMVVSINQRLDAGTIELLADEYDREVRFVDAEELTQDIEEDEEDSPEDLELRAPVVTVMGHVDHGKTSLLDYIRKTRVTAGEAGGITQHIGAHEVTHQEKKITFLDTPGHEAFTAMRARGAQVTDLVILVVAADDSVMPQTLEAINHAQAGGVPIVVAINKVDKPDASPDRIKQQLSEHNVIIEEWGGKVQYAEVSAKSGVGIDELLDKVLIEAELMELKANPDRKATGIVLETKIDKGKGIVSNILVQKGTLRVSDPFVAGPYFGRVRAMENEFGQRMQDVGPSTPAQVIGFDGMPEAGDKLVVTSDEHVAKDIAQQRQQIKREKELRTAKKPTLDDISRRMALGDIAELNLIIKGDVSGSIEALSGSLQKLSNDEVKVNIIHTGVGAITESDVLLASASEAIIIGFQVRPSSNARKIAEREEIEIRLFSVIYEAVDAVRDALEGMLSPEVKERTVATIEVRETFKVPKVGTVAGCYVTDGKIHRNSRIRLIRDGVVIHEGELASLKRFKDDVKEVASGYECGLNIKNYNDVKVGDVIEAYETFEEKRKLSSKDS